MRECGLLMMQGKDYDTEEPNKHEGNYAAYQ
jgi:hypothetical protein